MLEEKKCLNKVEIGQKQKKVIMKIKKAVITAAARGERLYPVADTVQKAMLPIIDIDGITRPIIQIIIEEAAQSGIKEISIILNNFYQFINYIIFV